MLDESSTKTGTVPQAHAKTKPHSRLWQCPFSTRLTRSMPAQVKVGQAQNILKTGSGHGSTWLNQGWQGQASPSEGRASSSQAQAKIRPRRPKPKTRSRQSQARLNTSSAKAGKVRQTQSQCQVKAPARISSQGQARPRNTKDEIKPCSIKAGTTTKAQPETKPHT